MGVFTTSLATSAGSGVANLGSNLISAEIQKSLLNNQYKQYFENMYAAGATPTSIIQGLTGTSVNSTPTASTGGNPFSDLGQTTIGAQNAQTNENKADSDIEVNRMRLRFDPQKYIADIEKALSESFKSTMEGDTSKSLRQLYDEQRDVLRQTKPWNLAKLKQGLLNDIALYDEIQSNIKKNYSESYRNYQQGYEAYTQGDLNNQLGFESQSRERYNDAMTDESYNRGESIILDNFQRRWRNTLLNSGIDPNSSFSQNMLRLSVTDPKRFDSAASSFIRAVGYLDDRLKENLGDHYKRNIAIGVGMHYLNNRLGEHNTKQSQRFQNYGSTISSFIPFTSGRTTVQGYRSYY